jgi:hypothetical protein
VKIGRSAGLPAKATDPVCDFRDDGCLRSHVYISPATTGKAVNDVLPPS